MREIHTPEFMHSYWQLIIVFLLLSLGACGGGGSDDEGGGDSNGNSIPIAIAGAHQSVTTGSTVSLDASGSSDGDDDTLTYSWLISASPTGSTAVLNSDAVTPSFTADVDGVYIISLTANDGKINSNTGTVIVIATSGAQPKILVDASKGGGTWWFPQSGPYNADEPHQGKALADYLKSLNYAVIELPRDTSITTTTELLTIFDVVIRASGFFGHSPEEIDAYHSYTNNGGSLLLLTDHGRFVETEALALSFGISFEGISRGDNIIDRFETHPITAGVSPLTYGVGSGITDWPVSANILGYLSKNTYLDLNDNEMQDATEPTGVPVLAEMSLGAGKIVFSGDVNMWETLPQPLVDNTIIWLTSP